MQSIDKQLKVTLNGATIEVDSGLTLGDLIDQRGLERRMIAIEYNGEILPRHQYDSTPLGEGDVLEIVQMVGGG